MNEQPEYLVDEALQPGLRYTEHTISTGQGDCRVCSLFRTGEEKPVSELKIFSFAFRFGTDSVDAEGFGGVSTDNTDRRKGYFSKLFRRSLAGVRERVAVVLLYGVEDLYHKFGFTACLPEVKLTLWVQRLLKTEADADWKFEPCADRYIPQIISLYNDQTAMRPWTRVRAESDWPRLMRVETWRPGPECMVLTCAGEFMGYAFIAGTSYGWTPRTYEVVELAAKSDAAAKALILELGKKSWERYCENLVLREPPDGRCGIIAKHFSCEVQTTFRERGGGMGAILDRPRLLGILEDELNRRASYGNRDLDDAALAELRDSVLVPDDGHLMRLLTGYWSWQEAEMWGAVASEERRKLLGAIFPGGQSPALLMPYSHSLDRY